MYFDTPSFCKRQYIKSHSTFHFLCFLIGKHTFPEAEPYVSHKENIRFWMGKPKKWERIWKILSKYFHVIQDFLGILQRI